MPLWLLIPLIIIGLILLGVWAQRDLNGNGGRTNE